MNYDSFVRGITFRRWQPENRSRLVREGTRLLTRLGVPVDRMNTVLPEADAELKARLSPLLRIPRMSTFAIAAMINRAVSELPADACFVNVGVWNGFSFLAGLAGNGGRRCIGVDNFSEFGGPRAAFLKRFARWRSANHQFYDQDYREYFARQHRGPIGFYIYDGEHSYENQMLGLETAEPFFVAGSLIQVDDTNAGPAREATQDFMKARAGQYELVLDRVTGFNKHLTFWNGVMVWRRRA